MGYDMSVDNFIATGRASNKRTGAYIHAHASPNAIYHRQYFVSVYEFSSNKPGDLIYTDNE